MDVILITTAVIAVIGVVVGYGLVYTGKKFHVEIDEQDVAVCHGFVLCYGDILWHIYLTTS